MSTYAILVDLLTNGSLDREECDDVAQQILDAASDGVSTDLTGPEADQAAKALALVELLEEFAATSDKLDAAHAQIKGMFDEGFPDYPHALMKDDGDLATYFAWLNAELAQWGTADGGYESLVFDTGVDDRITIFVVYRKHADKIVKLARKLDHAAFKPLTRYVPA
jgi:hypothetical protein